jgi:hypothetical protein
MSEDNEKKIGKHNQAWRFGKCCWDFFCYWEKNLIFTLSPRYWQSIINQPEDILVPNLTIRDDQI